MKLPKILIFLCFSAACNTLKRPQRDSERPGVAPTAPSVPAPGVPVTGTPAPEAPAPGATPAEPGSGGAGAPTSAASPAGTPDAAPKAAEKIPDPSTVSAIQKLSQIERMRLMAAAAAAAYCGDGSTCDVIQQFRDASRTLGSAFTLDGWKIAFLSARDSILDIEGYVFHRADAQDVVVSIRGSESDVARGAINDWINVNARVNGKYFGGTKITGVVHEGFLEGMYGIWHPNDTGLIKVIQDAKLRGKTFWVTGHSQGAAIAALIAMRFVEDDLTVQGVYAYGMPRLASPEFQTSYNRVLGSQTFVFANRQDPIPHLPPQFTSIGQNQIFWPPSTQALGKDGVPAWDLVTATLNGNAGHHSLTDRINGYFAGL